MAKQLKNQKAKKRLSLNYLKSSKNQIATCISHNSLKRFSKGTKLIFTADQKPVWVDFSEIYLNGEISDIAYDRQNNSLFIYGQHNLKFLLKY